MSVLFFLSSLTKRPRVGDVRVNVGIVFFKFFNRVNAHNPQNALNEAKPPENFVQPAFPQKTFHLVKHGVKMGKTIVVKRRKRIVGNFCFWYSVCFKILSVNIQHFAYSSLGHLSKPPFRGAKLDFAKLISALLKTRSSTLFNRKKYIWSSKKSNNTKTTSKIGTLFLCWRARWDSNPRSAP